MLLIYGGIGCMEPRGREYLDEIYAEIPRDKFEIVMFQDADNVQELFDTQDFGKMPYPLVSDLARDTNLFKAKYGCQAMPTCYLIDAKGAVSQVAMGMKVSAIDKFLGR